MTLNRSFSVLGFFAALLVGSASVVSAQTLTRASSPAAQWPQWRGPEQNGIADEGEYPVRWSKESFQSPAAGWSVTIPGLGGSTPVVAGSSAYVTSGVDGRNTLMAIDLANGATRWTVELGSDRGNKHRKGSGSNPSPVTDGTHVAAYYRSGDLACVDVTGKVVWNVNLQDEYGEDTLWWDLGSSPALVDGMVVVAVMQTGPSYLVAFDLTSGKQLWKVDRTLDAPEEAAQSYITPLAVTINGQSHIAVMGADHLTIHRSADGVEVGRLGGFNPNGEIYYRSIASPVASGNLIVCPYARGSTLTAVRMDRLVAGEGSGAIAWSRDDLGADVPTPAMRDGVIYLVSDSKQDKGTVYGLDAESGRALWSLTLPRTRISYSASPLVAGGRLYVIGEDARTSVIWPLNGGEPEVIATNDLGDDEPFTVASPVPLGDGLLLRTRHRLTKVVAN